MTGINNISSYLQTNRAWKDSKTERAGYAAASKTGNANAKANAADIEYKPWSPIDQTSSLVPRNTEYGATIGNVSLSDTAKEYYKELKSKFHDMDFIVVSKDMKDRVQQNAAAYGTAGRTVVLIDNEKLERMATDESFRKKYEGIIKMAQTQLSEAKNSLSGSGASVKNFGMSVDENGNTKFFATIENMTKQQKARIEKQAEERREQRVKERRQHEKEAREARLEHAREANAAEEADEREYVTFEADSFEDLLAKVNAFVYNNASANVMTESEKMLGTAIDYRG